VAEYSSSSEKPDIEPHPFIEKPEPAKASSSGVKVTAGSRVQIFETLGGKTVERIKDSLEEIWSIPNNAKIKINGKAASLDDSVQEGDHLEFIRPIGGKG
jgi:putative ubiquitin-RnfH superfamily antitoxin RatB of RatAB toxin-antitoxin module